MRDIKFRGKNIKTGEWIYGHYYREALPLQCIKSKDSRKEKEFIIYPGFADWNMPRPMYQAEVNCVGEYAGIKADNGIEIYEGDIVIKTPRLVSNVGPFKGVVKFDECAYWVDNGEDAELLFTEVDNLEIVGNIHDNPELMEVQA